MTLPDPGTTERLLYASLLRTVPADRFGVIRDPMIPDRRRPAIGRYARMVPWRYTVLLGSEADGVLLCPFAVFVPEKRPDKVVRFGRSR